MAKTGRGTGWTRTGIEIESARGNGIVIVETENGSGPNELKEKGIVSAIESEAIGKETVRGGKRSEIEQGTGMATEIEIGTVTEVIEICLSEERLATGTARETETSRRRSVKTASR